MAPRLFPTHRSTENIMNQNTSSSFAHEVCKAAESFPTQRPLFRNGPHHCSRDSSKFAPNQWIHGNPTYKIEAGTSLPA